jgi:glutathione S-transferase
MDRIKLFGLERSAYTRIARLALEEKGVDYALENAEIFGSGGVPDEHFKRHPFGRIPVLQHGTFALYETAAITRYVDESFAGPSLQPATAAARARMQQIIGILDNYAYQPMVWGVFVGGVLSSARGTTPEAGAKAVSEALGASAVCLDAIEKLAEGGDWLLGGRLGLADLHAFPILRFLSLAPEGMSLLSSRRHLIRWFEAMLARPSVVKTRTEYEPCPQPEVDSGRSEMGRVRPAIADATPGPAKDPS